ncbi:MAG: class I SAM-dependent methyltransferase [Pseudomonadota bacterium]|jgi:SAM-dependent methyltransferase
MNMINGNIKHEQTKNQCGFMHPLSATSKAFIDFASSREDFVVDIGCAYGIASIGALEAGAKHVVACDINQEHLDILKKRTPSKYISNKNLTLKLGKFPNEIDFDNKSVGAVLTSYILPYLTIDELELGLDKVFNWLVPGGKFFITSYTRYIKEFDNEPFIKEYDRRIQSGLKWPGYFENFNLYSSLKEENEASNAFPSKIHFLDKKSLEKVLKEIGFEIEEAVFLNGRLNGAVEETINDGRELLSIIAKKPI